LCLSTLNFCGSPPFFSLDFANGIRILNYHYKTWIPLFGSFLTIFGWWAWNFFLSAIYYYNPAFGVKDGFTQHFGKNLAWWAVFVAIIAVMVVSDLAFDAIKRWWWPSLVQRWQVLEQDPETRRQMIEIGGEGGYGIAKEES
jgi:phospholipid-translocating ATPase